MIIMKYQYNKNNVAWWTDGFMTESDFVNGLKYMVEKGIIRVIRF